MNTTTMNKGIKKGKTAAAAATEQTAAAAATEQTAAAAATEQTAAAAATEQTAAAAATAAAGTDRVINELQRAAYAEGFSNGLLFYRITENSGRKTLRYQFHAAKLKKVTLQSVLRVIIKTRLTVERLNALFNATETAANCGVRFTSQKLNAILAATGVIYVNGDGKFNANGIFTINAVKNFGAATKLTPKLKKRLDAAAAIGAEDVTEQGVKLDFTNSEIVAIIEDIAALYELRGKYAIALQLTFEALAKHFEDIAKVVNAEK